MSIPARNIDAWEKEDPESVAFFKENPAVADLFVGSLEAMRGLVGAMAPMDIPQEEGVEIKDITILNHGIPARIYSPANLSSKAPCVIVYHGGGYILGPISLENPTGISLAKAGAVVVNVDYRMAPEHVFPAAVEDAVGALHWVIENADSLKIDTSKMVVYGTSAGGCLAAVVAQHARDKQIKLAGQALRVPVCTSSEALPGDYPNESHSKFPNEPILRAGQLEMIKDYYAKDVDAKDPRISPAFGNLEGLAPCYIQLAGRDPLRDGGLAYGDLLKKAGVQVTVKVGEGQVHAYNILPTKEGINGQNEMVEAIKKFAGL